MSDVQRHKMLRSRQPSFLIGEDSLWLEATLEDGIAIPDPAPVKE